MCIPADAMALDTERLYSELGPLPPGKEKEALFLCSGLSLIIPTLPDEGSIPLEFTPLITITPWRYCNNPSVT